MSRNHKTLNWIVRFTTRGNVLWLVILVMIILTVVVMIWAAKQPPIHSEPGPPLSLLEASPIVRTAEALA